MANFISENYIKTKTPLSKNIDPADILNNVEAAEQLWLANILGKYFYTELLAKFNSQTLNSDETALVELIKPAVAYRAAAESVIFLTGQIKNKGIQTQNGENSNSVDESFMFKVEGRIRGRAEFFENLVRAHLKEYKDLFPDYTSENNNVIMPPDDTDNWDNGVMVI